MKFIKNFMALALMCVVGSGLVQAHHSATMFEAEKTLTLTGAVKEFQYTNPHAWLIITVADDSDETTDWSIELGAPTQLRAAGIGKRTYLPGQEVKAIFHPMKDGRPAGGHTISITNADGSPIN